MNWSGRRAALPDPPELADGAGAIVAVVVAVSAVAAPFWGPIINWRVFTFSGEPQRRLRRNRIVSGRQKPEWTTMITTLLLLLSCSGLLLLLLLTSCYYPRRALRLMISQSAAAARGGRYKPTTRLLLVLAAFLRPENLLSQANEEDEESHTHTRTRAAQISHAQWIKYTSSGCGCCCCGRDEQTLFSSVCCAGQFERAGPSKRGFRCRAKRSEAFVACYGSQLAVAVLVVGVAD